MSNTKTFVLAAVLVSGAFSRSALAVRIEEIPVPVSAPWGIAFDSKFNRFYAGGSQLGAFTSEEAGEYLQPAVAAADLREMTTTPDGHVWMAETSTNKIWRFGIVGFTAVAFTAPGGPTGIVLGPDGRVWFTEHSGNRIGRLSLGGALWESALLPTAGSKPGAITLAPDGNLWFVEESANKLGCITPGGTITEYPLPTAGALPSGIAVGAAGLFAITEAGLDKIIYFSITSHTFVEEQSIPSALSGAHGIVHGPDGAFWFVEQATSKIGRSSPGGQITEFLIPTGGCHPRQIAAGPDGNIWFTEESTGKVARIVLDSSADVNGDEKEDVSDVFYLINYLFAGGPEPVLGSVMTDLPQLAGAWGIGVTPFLNSWAAGGAGVLLVEEDGEATVHTTGASDLRDLAISPDGSAWIVEPSANKIWRYTMTGIATPFTVPGTPTGITAGPDGNVWFTEYTGNKIGRLTPSGVLWESASIPTAGSHPTGITVGPDGNLWFVEEAGNKFARVTPSGVITEYLLPTAGALPYGIAVSAGGYFAITEPGINKIAYGRINDPSVLPDEATIPTPGSSPRSIAIAADGNFWFTENHSGRITRFERGLAHFLEMPVPTASSQPRQIVAGRANDLWFTEEATGKVGHILLHRHGDVDADGEITVADVFTLINFLFAGGPAPK
jgi:streptogramin lyase